MHAKYAMSSVISPYWQGIVVLIATIKTGPSMKQITDLNDLRLFVQVVDHGSFTAAARSLGAQTSKLSRRIRACR